LLAWLSAILRSLPGAGESDGEGDAGAFACFIDSDAAGVLELFSANPSGFGDGEAASRAALGGVEGELSREATRGDESFFPGSAVASGAALSDGFASFAATRVGPSPDS
jgi:hypothetical protein